MKTKQPVSILDLPTKRVRDVQQQATEWAENLKVGDVFRGSRGEANHRFTVKPEVEIFSTFAFSILNDYKEIVIDNDTLEIVKLIK